MSYVLDLASTHDTYDELRCSGSTKLSMQISGAAVLIGLGQQGSPGGAIVYQNPDEPYLPVVGSITRRPFDAVRIKSKVPGNPATATLIAT